MAATFEFNPLSLVGEVFDALYPNYDCTIRWANFPEGGPFGETEFADGGAMLVTVATNIPIEGAVDVLAHELAHVAAGYTEDHGPAWEAAFDAIHAEYCRRVSRSAVPAPPSPED